MKSFVAAVILLFISILSFAQEPIHPRSVISMEDVLKARKNLDKEPYKTIYERLVHVYNDPQYVKKDFMDRIDSDKALIAAVMYLMTDNKKYAMQSYLIVLRYLNEIELIKDPFSFGLSRAFYLRNLALTYDFAYNGWTPDQRKYVNKELLELTKSVQSSMGYAGNYSLVSNWMGVRYGSVALGALVYDDEETKDKSKVTPYWYEASRRLGEHMAMNIYPNGFNAESIGYHGYAY